MRKLQVYIVWAFTVLLGCGPSEAGRAAFGMASARAEVERVVADYELPSLAIAIAKEGEVIWEEGFGFANLEEQVPATEHTMYSLASISKPITATGMMILVERGLIDLDAPIDEYLGDAKLNGRAFDAEGATVGAVANHTAGLPLHYQFFYEDEPYRRPPMDVTIARYANLVTAPGERFNYSNLGYGLLDYVIARTSGQSYPDFMRDEVFEPLGLTRTSVDIAEGLEEHAAERYASDGWRIPFYDFDHPGGSAVYASAHDLIRFGLFHAGVVGADQTGVIGDESRDRMTRPGSASGEPPSYGLGWSLSELPGGIRIIRHGGGMGGVSTQLAIAPDEDAAVVVLANASSPAVSYVTNVLWSVIFPDRVPPTDPPPLPGDDSGSGPESPDFEATAELIGEWRGIVDTYDGERELVVRVRDDGADVSIDDGPESPLGNARFDGRYLRGTFSGELGTEDVRRTTHVLSMELRLRGDVMNGSVTAISVPKPRVGNALTHWAEVRR